MSVPPLVHYDTPDEYRTHYERVYCQQAVNTFDGFTVRFRKDQFDHCFFESSNRNRVKDLFSSQRAERIDWIKATLENPNADLFVGWDGTRKRYDHTHRVAVVVHDYVVVIRLGNAPNARFVTAYVADSERTIRRIRSSPRWQPPRA